MNKKELNRLLESYYSGESSREEELLLRDFFTGEDVPEGYEAEKEIFRYYSQAAEMPEPGAGFEGRIIAAAGEEKPAQRSRLRSYLYPLTGAAAAVLIAAGAYFYYGSGEKLKDTYNDPQVAYRETRRILFQVSARMNHATLALEPVGKMNRAKTRSLGRINRSAVIVEKSLKNLELLKGRQNGTSD